LLKNSSLKTQSGRDLAQLTLEAMAGNRLAGDFAPGGERWSDWAKDGRRELLRSFARELERAKWDTALVIRDVANGGTLDEGSAPALELEDMIVGEIAPHQQSVRVRAGPFDVHMSGDVGAAPHRAKLSGDGRRWLVLACQDKLASSAAVTGSATPRGVADQPVCVVRSASWMLPLADSARVRIEFRQFD